MKAGFWGGSTLGLVLFAAIAGAQPAEIETVPSPELAKDARASRLIGSPVYARDAEVGTIEDLMIDRDTSHVAAAIISVSGILGMTDKRVAIPLDALKIGDQGHLTVDIPRAAIENAPAFTGAE